MSRTSLSIAAGSEAPGSRLETLPPEHPDLTLGYEAAAWAQEWLVQPNGPKAGQPFRLTFDQFRFLLWWYALDDEGQWLYQHAARRLAKGSGKSPFAAVLALIEFLAPVRFKDKDARFDGGCVGKPVDMPLVQIAATAESQTANTMRMIRAFAPKNSRLADRYHLDVGKTRYYRMPEGTLEVITSSATAAEGAEATFIVGDETENWTPSNGGHELVSALEDNLAKSGSRMLETSNAWVPGIDSVAERTWDAWVLQEEGRTRGEAGRILYDARIAAPDADVWDYDKLTGALRWVYGDCDWKRGPDGEIDVRDQIKKIWSPRSDLSASKRKYLNWPTAHKESWVEPEEWNRLADPEVVVADGDEIVLFFDGSRSRDTTALIGCRLDDGHVFTLGVWEPDPTDDESVVDAEDVDRVVMQTFDRYRVLAFFADVREWESFVLTEWPRRWKDELLVWAVPSGRPPQPIAWDMRGHKDEFAKAVEACHAEIVEGGFTHDGDSRVARHVANARRDPYRMMVSIRKESHDSRKKIDAAVCVVGARMARRMALAAAPKKRAGQFRGFTR